MQHKTEAAFLSELEQRSHQEQRLLQTEVLPMWARGLGRWLVVNPWRVLIPIAALLYLILRIFYGTAFSELTLQLFGGFR